MKRNRVLYILLPLLLLSACNSNNTPMTAITLNANSISLVPGKSFTLSIVSAKNGSAVRYVSDNDKIAAVDASGNITAIAPGITKITAYSDHLSAICYVDVYNEEAMIHSFSSPITAKLKSETLGDFEYHINLNATIQQKEQFKLDGEFVFSLDETYGKDSLSAILAVMALLGKDEEPLFKTYKNLLDESESNPAILTKERFHACLLDGEILAGCNYLDGQDEKCRYLWQADAPLTEFSFFDPYPLFDYQLFSDLAKQGKLLPGQVKEESLVSLLSDVTVSVSEKTTDHETFKITVGQKALDSFTEFLNRYQGKSPILLDPKVDALSAEITWSGEEAKPSRILINTTIQHNLDEKGSQLSLDLSQMKFQESYDPSYFPALKDKVVHWGK